MRLAVCVPLGESVNAITVKCLVDEIELLRHKITVKVFLECSCYVAENRNLLVKKALAWGAEKVLFIDADMVFKAENVLSLIQAGWQKDFVSGVYFNNVSNPHPVAYMKTVTGYDSIGLDDLQKLVVVDAVGFGFALVSKELLEKMLKRKRRLFQVKYEPRFLGEDFVFCELAEECGAKPLLVSSVVVGHVKGVLGKEVLDA